MTSNATDVDRSDATLPLTSPALSAWLAVALVFGTSAAVLVLEILASRLLAPYVGVSLETYTGIIGTILAGIAVGAWAGGVLADRVDPREHASDLTGIAGIAGVAQRRQHGVAVGNVQRQRPAAGLLGEDREVVGRARDGINLDPADPKLADRRGAYAAARAGHDGGAIAIQRHGFSFARYRATVTLPTIAHQEAERAMAKKLFPDGTEVAGFYVRTIRSGPFVFVSGTTSLDSKGRVRGKNAAEQTTITMRKIEAGLKSAGARLADLARTTIYVTDIRDMGDVSKALGKTLKGSVVTSTLVAVSALAVPGLLLEIEATAVVER